MSTAHFTRRSRGRTAPGRRAFAWAGFALILAAGSGCQPQAPTSSAASGPQAPQPPQAAAIDGVDLSHWQGAAVNFASIRQAGKAFVFIKATNGASGVDPDYARNVQQARSAGLAVGSYHYYVSSDAPDAQFRNLSAQVKVQKGDLPPIVDIEALSQGNNPALAPALQQFLDAMERQYGVKPIMYSGEYFASQFLAGFSAYPLWLAEYNGKDSPQLPTDWTRWTFWQYTKRGSVAGVQGHVDLNRFNGSLAQFQALRIQ